MTHHLSPEAEFDLDDIWHYLATESGSIEIADRVIDSIVDKFFLLATNPHLGRNREDLRVGARSFPVGKYIILYRIENNIVLIQRVLHGSRNIEALFRS